MPDYSHRACPRLWACGPPKVIKSAPIRQPLSMGLLPYPCHPDRSVPGFPTTQNAQHPRMRLSVKRGARPLPKPTKSTGNSGERSGGTCGSNGPFVEMLFERAKPKDLGDTYWQMIFGAFRPQTIRKIKKASRLTDQEMAFAHLVLSGTMNDRRAAEAVGLKFYRIL